MASGPKGAGPCDTKLPNGIARGELVRCAETGAIYFRQNNVLRQLSPEAYTALGRPRYRDVPDCAVVRKCTKGADVTAGNFKSIKVTAAKDNCTVPRGRVVKCASTPSIYLGLGTQLREFTPPAWAKTGLGTPAPYDCGMIAACSRGKPIQPADLAALPVPKPPQKQPPAPKPPAPKPPAPKPAPRPKPAPEPPAHVIVRNDDVVVGPVGGPAPSADLCRGYGTMNDTGEWCVGNCDKAVFDCALGGGWFGRSDGGNCVNCRLQNPVSPGSLDANKFCSGYGTMNDTGEWCVGGCDKAVFDCPLGNGWMGRMGSDGNCVNCRLQNRVERDSLRQDKLCSGYGTMNNTGEWCTGGCDKGVFDCPLDNGWMGRTGFGDAAGKCLNCKLQNPTPRKAEGGGGYGGGKVDAGSGSGSITSFPLSTRVSELRNAMGTRGEIKFSPEQRTGSDGRAYLVYGGEWADEQLKWLVELDNLTRKIYNSAKARHGANDVYTKRLGTLVADPDLSYIASQYYTVANFDSFTTIYPGGGTQTRALVPGHPYIAMAPWWQANFPMDGPNRKNYAKERGKAVHLFFHEVGHAISGLWGHNEQWVHAWHWILHEAEAAGVWKHADLFLSFKPDNEGEAWDNWDPYDDAVRDRLINTRLKGKTMLNGRVIQRDQIINLWANNPDYAHGFGCPCGADLSRCC